MAYNWKELVPPGIKDPAQVAAHLNNRVSRMSAKEWRIFRAALEMYPPEDLANVAALAYHLHEFEFYYPAFDDTSLGEQVAEFNYGVRSDVMSFLDLAMVGAAYRQEHPGTFIDDAFVPQLGSAALDRLHMKTEDIREYDFPTDTGWSAKLHIAGPDGRDVWLRLPDYEEVNGGQADELRIVLDDLGVETLDGCTLLEARCVLPQIDLMDQYDDLKQLVFDASNLGFALFESDNGQSQPWCREKLNAALAYEACEDLNHAIDIISNPGCYDFIPNSELHDTAERLLPTSILSQPAILKALDYEAYAAEHFRSKGMWEVDGGFFMRNDNEFHYEYSAPRQESAQAVAYSSDISGPEETYEQQMGGLYGP